MEVDKCTVKICADTTELDIATSKLERLCELLKEAKSLVDDLASNSNEINLKI